MRLQNIYLQCHRFPFYGNKVFTFCTIFRLKNTRKLESLPVTDRRQEIEIFSRKGTIFYQSRSLVDCRMDILILENDLGQFLARPTDRNRFQTTAMCAHAFSQTFQYGRIKFNNQRKFYEALAAQDSRLM